MKQPFRPALVIMTIAGLFCVLTQSCSNKNEVEVSTRNFDAEVDQQQNLAFTFNKDLHPDSLLQQWDSTQYIEFSPKVRGAFQWTSSSQLQFSPAQGFLPGTDYTATLTRALLTSVKKTTAPGLEKYHQISYGAATCECGECELCPRPERRQRNDTARPRLQL